MSWKEGIYWTCDTCGSDGSYIGKIEKTEYVGNFLFTFEKTTKCDCPQCIVQRRYFRDEITDKDGRTWSQKLKEDFEPKRTQKEVNEGLQYVRIDNRWKLVKVIK